MEGDDERVLVWEVLIERTNADASFVSYPCVLIDIDGLSVLTDPYFDDHWCIPMNEPIGMRADGLPELAAILGGHRVFDHWQPRSLRTYPHRSSTPVFVASKGMARSALRAGFEQVEILRWQKRRELGGGLTLECVPGERSSGMTTNSYVLSTPSTTIYIGTEARHLDPIATLPPTDGWTLRSCRLMAFASRDDAS
jgi:L-ascorbate metabolism protein UlaG (beta-lactamase superfamily)